MFGHDSLGTNMIAKNRTFSPFRNNYGLGINFDIQCKELFTKRNLFKLSKKYFIEQ